MFFRGVVVAACALLLGGCQQAGPPINATAGVTAPSSLSIKPVDVPFSAVLIGEAFFDFTNPNACASGFTAMSTGQGTASHMGLTTFRSAHCLGANHEPLNTEFVLTAANGDMVHATYTGRCPANFPQIGERFTCSGVMVFSEGTGRFASASGTGEWTGTVTFEGFADFSWPGRWELKGTIRY